MTKVLANFVDYVTSFTIGEATKTSKYDTFSIEKLRETIKIPKINLRTPSNAPLISFIVNIFINIVYSSCARAVSSKQKQ